MQKGRAAHSIPPRKRKAEVTERKKRKQASKTNARVTYTNQLKTRDVSSRARGREAGEGRVGKPGTKPSPHLS